jgi:prepilin-type N-terminal cleavage/methylation domain-containing protein
MNIKKHPFGNSSGFTLLEVMVAASIVGILGIFIHSIVLKSQSITKVSNTQAQNLSSFVLEQKHLRNTFKRASKVSILQDKIRISIKELKDMAIMETDYLYQVGECPSHSDFKAISKFPCLTRENLRTKNIKYYQSIRDPRWCYQNSCQIQKIKTLITQSPKRVIFDFFDFNYGNLQALTKGKSVDSQTIKREYLIMEMSNIKKISEELSLTREDLIFL